MERRSPSAGEKLERAWRSLLFVPVLLTAWCLPRSLQRALARVTARCVQRLAPRLRARIEKNLSLISARPRSPAELNEDVRSVLTNYGYVVLDFLALRRGRVPRLAAIRGSEHLATARASGRGVIFVTAHFGSWEMAAYFLAGQAEQVTLVSFPEEIGWLGRLRTLIRRSQRHDEILLGNDPLAVLDLLRRLRAGGLVGMQLDRVPGTSHAGVSFGRGVLAMPRGPARLALAADALLLPVYALLCDDGGYELQLAEAVDPRGREESAILVELAAGLESRVRACPRQWVMMQDPWLETTARDASATRLAQDGTP